MQSKIHQYCIKSRKYSTILHSIYRKINPFGVVFKLPQGNISESTHESHSTISRQCKVQFLKSSILKGHNNISTQWRNSQSTILPRQENGNKWRAFDWKEAILAKQVQTINYGSEPLKTVFITYRNYLLVLISSFKTWGHGSLANFPKVYLCASLCNTNMCNTTYTKSRR